MHRERNSIFCMRTLFSSGGWRPCIFPQTLFCGLLALLISLAPLSLLNAPPTDFPKGAVIRDAEIEDALRAFIDPLLVQAGINPKKLKLFVINDSTINAFATFGPMIVIHTGLLMRCRRVEELLAVLAHEIGHIKGSHIAPRIDALNKAMTESLIGMGLGAVLTVITGSTAPWLLGSSLGGQLGARKFLSFNRSQEMQADLISVQLLKALNWPTDGAASLFQMFQEESTGLSSQQMVYMQTHPLPQERLDVARQNAHSGGRLPPKFPAMFWAIQAKIAANTDRPDVPLRLSFYKTPEMLVYGQAIQAYRKGSLKQATKAFEKLVVKDSQNPYFQEQLAGLYLDQGKMNQALTAINKAIGLSPKPHTLLRLTKAHILILQNKNLSQAEQLLKTIVLEEPWNGAAWYFLGTAAGRLGSIPESRLYLAEYQTVRGNMKEARQQLAVAKKGLPKNSALMLRAEDLEALLKQERGH